MRKLTFLALALGLLLSAPGRAQQVITAATGYGTAAGGGTVTASLSATSTSDATSAVLPISGVAWASAVLSISGTYDAVVTSTISVDGTNWVSAPQWVRTDATATSPSTTSTIALAANTSATYEMFLPANTKKVRAWVGTWRSGTVNLILAGGRLAAPGVPVVATLYDATSTVSAAIDTGVWDLQGWNRVDVYAQSGSGTAALFTANALDDAGATLAVYTNATATSTTPIRVTQTRAGTPGTSVSWTQTGGNLTQTSATLPKRGSWTWAAATGQLNRVRVEASR